MTITNSGNGSGSTSAVINLSSALKDYTNIQYSNCGSASSVIGGSNITISNITAGTSNNCVVTFYATVKSPNTEGLIFHLTADVAASSQGGNDPAAVNSRNLTVNITPIFSTSTFSISDTNGDTFAPGDPVNYTLTIINSGDGNASGVALTNTFNNKVNINAASLNFSNCGSSYTNSTTASGLNISNLAITTDANCVITFSGALKSPMNENTSVFDSSINWRCH
jgi:uncharacterized repeat protein (TIGR01451 family)